MRSARTELKRFAAFTSLDPATQSDLLALIHEKSRCAPESVVALVRSRSLEGVLPELRAEIVRSLVIGGATSRLPEHMQLLCEDRAVALLNDHAKSEAFRAVRAGTHPATLGLLARLPSFRRLHDADKVKAIVRLGELSRGTSNPHELAVEEAARRELARVLQGGERLSDDPRLNLWAYFAEGRAKPPLSLWLDSPTFFPPGSPGSPEARPAAPYVLTPGEILPKHYAPRDARRYELSIDRRTLDIVVPLGAPPGANVLTAEDIAEAFARLPEASRRYARAIRVTPFANPRDRFQRQPTQTKASVDRKGNVSFWREYPRSLRELTMILAHEVGHRALGNVPGWEPLAASDGTLVWQNGTPLTGESQAEAWMLQQLVAAPTDRAHLERAIPAQLPAVERHIATLTTAP